jgi:hypothetical protein
MEQRESGIRWRVGLLQLPVFPPARPLLRHQQVPCCVPSTSPAASPARPHVSAVASSPCCSSSCPISLSCTAAPLRPRLNQCVPLCPARQRAADGDRGRPDRLRRGRAGRRVQHIQAQRTATHSRLQRMRRAPPVLSSARAASSARAFGAYRLPLPALPLH